MANSQKFIVIDADVIIHLYKAERISILVDLYSGRLLILDIVLQELLNNRTISADVEMLLKLQVAKELQFPSHNSTILQEYNILKRTKGKGESACMAVCRYDKTVLASSNLLDIKSYCTQHSIEYLTTIDILSVAFKRGIISMAEADACIRKILEQNSKLPCTNLKAYLDSGFNEVKCKY